jgi:hypothetical protein
MPRRFAFTALLAAFTISAASSALGGTDVVVMADQAKLLSVGGEPSTVVVGNPNIADVTVQGTNVFVHGRNFGSTNLIVLDKEGNQLANLDVTVMLGGNHNLNVYRGGSKYSYVCAPLCQVVVQVGDKLEYFDGVADETAKKNGLATGAAAK